MPRHRRHSVQRLGDVPPSVGPSTPDDRIQPARTASEIADAIAQRVTGREVVRSAGASELPPHGLATSAGPATASNIDARSTVIMDTGDLGRLVRAARERRNLSQQDFADLAGVGRRFVSELENGKSTLELGKVLQTASAAGIDVLARPRG